MNVIKNERDNVAMSNYACVVEAVKLPDGVDVVVQPRGEYVVMPEIDADSGRVTVRIRRDAGPRIGDTVMVNRRAIVVADRRWDTRGHLQLRDADTGTWEEWA